MTDDIIKKYIDQLNESRCNDLVFTREISDSVELAAAWAKEPKEDDEIVGNFASYRFFFIKDEKKRYVGAVLDMGIDLHWFIQEDNRKRGHLTNALKEAIIPYIYENIREVIRITIDRDLENDNYRNSKKVAGNLGFKCIDIDETEFELKSEEFNWDYEKLKEKDVGLSEDRSEILRKKVEYAFKSLNKISDELLMAYGDDMGLFETAKDVRKYTLYIEDLMWELKNSSH